MELKIPETYYWSTNHDHFNNETTMSEFLDDHLSETCDIIYVDGTYAEILTEDGIVYGVHASGNGDSYNHKIEFEEI